MRVNFVYCILDDIACIHFKDGLKQEDSCAGETRSACLRLKRQEVIQIAQGFATCDSLSEPRMAMASTIQLFELMRINFVYLFRHLSIL